MSNRELYKTLTGYDYPHGAKSEDSTKNIRFVELNETLDIDKNTGYSKMLIADTDIPSTVKLRNGNNGILRSRDSFEWSDGKNNKTSADRPKYSNDIDFNDKYVQMVIYSRNFYELSSGIEGGVPTKERIAEYYGKMAKRLDEAYAEGKFTKEEYDYLNEGIAERKKNPAAGADNTGKSSPAVYHCSTSYKTSTGYHAMANKCRQE